MEAQERVGFDPRCTEKLSTPHICTQDNLHRITADADVSLCEGGHGDFFGMQP